MNYNRTHPRARREHRCELCRRAIRPGEIYMRGSGFGSGEAFTWKECAHCDLYAQLVTRRLGEEEYSFDVLAEWDEPRTIAEARVRSQWRRQWTNRRGDLYPIPNLIFAEDRFGFGWPAAIEPGTDEEAA